MTTILVTGATGRVGGALIEELLASGGADVTVRALVRDPGAAGLPTAVEVRRGDLHDVATVAAAAEGADAAFLLWTTGEDDDAADVVATLAGTGRIVYLSAIGVDRDGSDPEVGPILASHRRLESLVAASGARWTAVRGGGFAANTLGWAEGIRGESVVREAFGGIPRPLVHERDLAAVAAYALLGRDLDGATPEVTGPAVVTGREQVDAIAAALGLPIRLEPLTAEEAVAQLTATTGDEATARSMVAAWAAMVADPESPTDTVPRLLGRPALTYAQWARDHVADFR